MLKEVKNHQKSIAVAALATLALTVGFLYWKYARGILPALAPPSENITESIEKGDMPLHVPDGFSVSLFARDLPGARVMAFDRFGNMWVSQTSEGKVTLIEVEGGEAMEQTTIFRGLRRPHGIAFDPQNGLDLYIAEEGMIRRVRTYSELYFETITELPTKGGGHFTRTIAFGPDDKLYVSVGSSCNVCREDDEERAAILRMERDGSEKEILAEGLRNAVFFTWSYVDGRMWATEMGRDHLGDDLPPDEINVIEEGFYGWPYCYGGAKGGTPVRDMDFEPRSGFDCARSIPSFIDLGAHVAPLGLAFVPEEGWPEEMWYDLLVAYHGSWNSSEPVGYKVARLKLDEKGAFSGEENFITGWLTDEGEVPGRPVHIILQPGGVGYISDDKAGVIYKITRTEQSP